MHIGGHHYCACLENHFWRILWESYELYITSNRPHLKRRRFHEFFGYYPENLSLGMTEETFCHHCHEVARDRPNPLNVYIPLDLPTESGWQHVGQSWQEKGL
jgi:hypothetical protein